MVGDPGDLRKPDLLTIRSGAYLPPVASLLLQIEQAKADPDPAMRDEALQAVEGQVNAELGEKPDDQELTDLLGTVRTYRGDARVQLEGATSGK